MFDIDGSTWSRPDPIIQSVRVYKDYDYERCDLATEERYTERKLPANYVTHFLPIC
jgi:hypothetical protein